MVRWPRRIKPMSDVPARTPLLIGQDNLVKYFGFTLTFFINTLDIINQNQFITIYVIHDPLL